MIITDFIEMLRFVFFFSLYVILMSYSNNSHIQYRGYLMVANISKYTYLGYTTEAYLPPLKMIVALYSL